mmetsp:Transcript_50098/g.141201  ORF Transcript_50098/g.141201 Transcript_50098/m.141201 type:complete len:268 (-) Transcript_50098:815-1618(-)
MARPSSEARWAQKAASEMRSSPAWSSSAKYSSTVTPFFCTSLRILAEASADLVATMDLQAARMEARLPELFFAAASTFTDIFWRSRFASNMGPFTALLTFSSCALMHALASSQTFLAASSLPSHSFRVAAGVANSRRAPPFRAAAGATTSSKYFMASSTAPIDVATAPRMPSASLRSRASRWAFFSASSRLRKSLFACIAFAFSVLMLDSAAMALGRSFATSARASARGPTCPAPSSSSFALNEASTFAAACRDSSIPLSIFATNSL